MIDLRKGDCLELMKDIPDGSVDMILCDPPYGIDYQSFRKIDKTKRHKKIIGDKTPFLEPFPLLKRILKPDGCVAIFTRWDVQQRFIDAMSESDLRPSNAIIWDKTVHGMGDLKKTYASRYETILFHPAKLHRFIGKRPVDIIVVAKVSPNKLVHPNEKPVSLLETLITKNVKTGGGSFGFLHG